MRATASLSKAPLQLQSLVSGLYLQVSTLGGDFIKISENFMVHRNIDQVIICIPKGVLEEIFRKKYVHTYLAPPWPKILINGYKFEKITYTVLDIYVSHVGIKWRILTGYQKIGAIHHLSSQDQKLL